MGGKKKKNTKGKTHGRGEWTWGEQGRKEVRACGHLQREGISQGRTHFHRKEARAGDGKKKNGGDVEGVVQEKGSSTKDKGEATSNVAMALRKGKRFLSRERQEERNVKADLKVLQMKSRRSLEQGGPGGEYQRETGHT